MTRALMGLIIVGALHLSCTKKDQKRFVQMSADATHITFKNELHQTPDLNILTYLYYYNGAGVAIGDFNNDGFEDIYFVSNLGADKLYLNKGNFDFEDITEKSQIRNIGNWTTGITQVDINNDGLLDLYICKIGNYGTVKGHNLLYVNQGLDSLGIPTFKEAARSYGLDFSGLSTHAAFFDYDLDGDLDMFLLNHSVHPNRTYGKGTKRMEYDSISGDRLYKNDNGFYVDVSKQSGIFQGSIGYGLGLSIGDINNDGYPDIYVGNDFFENDYLYMNQKDGTFKEIISQDDKKLGHTTHFSMGNSIVDINNDGLPDIISLDMLPEDLETYKTSGLEYSYPTYANYLKNGYAPQYMQNTLHLNLGNGSFSEVAHLSGIAATEWSWGVLAADFDNDGHKDLYISNGIKGATNDMDFINFISNDQIQKKINGGMSLEDMSLIDKIPEKKVSNYFFKNTGDLRFRDVTTEWFQNKGSFSNGCVYADLDNDGDLDLVVNNINQEAFLLQNTSNNENHYLKIDFQGDQKNPYGIGAKILAYTSHGLLEQGHFTTKGYLSSVGNTMHMGLGKDSIVDSLTVIWPGGKFQKMLTIKANQKLVLKSKDANGDFYITSHTVPIGPFSNVETPIPFKHQEQMSIEFNRDPLVPYANTNEGPNVSVADINKDGLDDLFITGAKGQASALFVQDEYGSFLSVQEDLFTKDAMSEDTYATFFDANGDGTLDLLVVSGGNEYKSSEKLRPRLYINQEGVFIKDEKQFNGLEVNASKVEAVDFDNDGDLDITITSDQVPWQFGMSPLQYIFENDGKGNFKDVTVAVASEFRTSGNVKDFVWIDLDGNGFKDLIAVGHWMPISIFINDGTRLTLQDQNGLGKTNGWWNTLIADDFDNDGDIDLIVGNWGENSKFKASGAFPVKLYSYDFDNNGTVESLVTHFYKNKETPFASKDELMGQMPILNKKFLSYKDYAKATIADLFSSEKLGKAYQKEVYELRSCIFENDGSGVFKLRPLPDIAQVSIVQAIISEDYNHDGYKDLFLVGNNYEINTQLGRMDALHGLILVNDRKGGFYRADFQNYDISGPARNVNTIIVDGFLNYIVSVNNGFPLFLKRNSDQSHE